MSNPKEIINVSAELLTSFTEVTLDNVTHVEDFRNREFSILFRSFLKDGQIGLYAWINNSVVGHAWAIICRGSHYCANGYMDIYNTEAFIYFCNVSEKYRGLNIYPTMLSIICHKLFSQGKVSRIIIDTEYNNSTSQHGIAKVGFKLGGRGTYIQINQRLIIKYFVAFNYELTPRIRNGRK
jgi:hypothetical protein